MNRLIVYIVFLTCAFTSVEAQVNYVRNGSFEQKSQCPDFVDQIRYAKYWTPIDTTTTSPVCLAEYCNICAASGVSIPSGVWYNQYPRSGGGMIMAMMYSDESQAAFYTRDYIQGRFYRNLLAGKSYCVTFYVSLAEESKYGINNIGAFLDNGSIDNGQDSMGCAAPQTAFSPQVIGSSVITDLDNWTKIQGTFIAGGNERFITLGNFSDKVHTSTAINPVQTSGSWISLYLFDDVSVIESNAVANAGPDKLIGVGDSVLIGTNEEGMPCTWYKSGSSVPIGYSGGIWVKPTITTTYIVEMDLCGHVTRDSAKVSVFPAAVKSVAGREQFVIWPNPTSNELTIEFGHGCDASIYDALGRLKYNIHLLSDQEVIRLSSFTPGIYILHIVDPTTGFKITKKIIKE